MTEIPWSQIILAASTLAASLVGYLLAGINESRRDRRTLERERTIRAEERHDAAVRARHEFQLETMLALQDAVQLMARLTGRTLHFDHMQARDGQQTQLPDGYSEETHANEVDVSRLRNRLLGTELRGTIESFERICRRVSLTPSGYTGLDDDQVDAHAGLLYMELDQQYTQAMDQLGSALRAELSWTPDVDRSHVRAHA